MKKGQPWQAGPSVVPETRHAVETLENRLSPQCISSARRVESDTFTFGDAPRFSGPPLPIVLASGVHWARRWPPSQNQR